jgi:EAL domain-containing protein (putative c-di-GMP-specific phosphodiesterase class I)
MLSGLVAMLHELGAPVVVEGVETDEHLALARALGVELAQGHLFGQAISAQALLTGLA